MTLRRSTLSIMSQIQTNKTMHYTVYDTYFNKAITLSNLAFFQPSAYLPIFSKIDTDHTRYNARAWFLNNVITIND
jgi:hypothetical protein